MEKKKPLELIRKDPIHKVGGKWWFWDEIWVDRIGPWTTRKDAKLGIKLYCEFREMSEKYYEAICRSRKGRK